jgi:hypothetical protein
VEFDLARGLLTMKGNLRALEGHIQLALSARPLDSIPQFDVTRVRFEGIVIDSLSSRPGA